jgi:integrase
VKAVLAGIRRTIGAAPVRKAPVMPELAIAMTTDTGSIRALRNRAIVLLGFASATRRSEIVALNVEDIEWRETGILITISQSKTDKDATPPSSARATSQPTGLSLSHSSSAFSRR